MSTLLIVSALAVIVSAAVVYFKSELNFCRTNHGAAGILKSPFDVPSLFNNRQHKNQIYSGWNVAGVKEERHSPAVTSTGNSAEPKNISMTHSKRDRANFRYTHITERMTLVNTH